MELDPGIFDLLGGLPKPKPNPEWERVMKNLKYAFGSYEGFVNAVYHSDHQLSEAAVGKIDIEAPLWMAVLLFVTAYRPKNEEKIP